MRKCWCDSSLHTVLCYARVRRNIGIFALLVALEILLHSSMHNGSEKYKLHILLDVVLNCGQQFKSKDSEVMSEFRISRV